jgi:hypothetical protein
MESQADRSVARAAENEVVFRNANQEIERRRGELDVPGLTPFLCECEEEHCKSLIFLSQEEYALGRTKPNWFILSPGHQFRSGTIRSSTDRFMLVEKDGLAKELAERKAT